MRSIASTLTAHREKIVNKRHFVLTIFVIFFIGANSASAQDFREVSWGMSPVQVKAIEGKTPDIDSEDLRSEALHGRVIIYYDQYLLGMDCTLGYIFVEGKLIRAKYAFEEVYWNNDFWIASFYEVQEALKKKYGSPTEEEVIALKDPPSYCDGPGDEMYYGHSHYYTTWETETTRIVLFLSSENRDPSFGIEYISKELEALEAKAKKEDTEGKL